MIGDFAIDILQIESLETVERWARRFGILGEWLKIDMPPEFVFRHKDCIGRLIREP